jgi:glycosyltransferase involved in cell wall biosynthesis
MPKTTTTSQPKITVVTPSYNQGKFLERTIRSVLAQNYPNLEYMVIDGGSTDNSVDIIRKYADKLTYWVSEKDNGQANALNKGFKKATGEIVAWLNSDDEYCQGALEAAAQTFADNPSADIIFGDNFDIDENGNILRDNRHTRFSFTALVVLGSIFVQPASFWRRTLFEKHGYLDESKYFCMDYDFFCRIGGCIKAKHIRKHLAKFRWHCSSKSNTSLSIQQIEHCQIREKYLKQVCKGFPEKLVMLAMQVYRAYWFLLQGDGMYVLRGVCRRAFSRILQS